jgi:hypothetical protein
MPQAPILPPSIASFAADNSFCAIILPWPSAGPARVSSDRWKGMSLIAGYVSEARPRGPRRSHEFPADGFTQEMIKCS